MKAKGEPTRLSYGEALLALGSQNPNVVSLDADVSKPMKTFLFAAKFPERSFNFGIAEQNMMAAAAGMATTGLIPFANTYAVFASMRALDMVRNSIHYPHLNVKIAASHSGLTPGPDGVTHQAQEDLSINSPAPGRLHRDCTGRPDEHQDGRLCGGRVRGAGVSQLDVGSRCRCSTMRRFPSRSARPCWCGKAGDAAIIANRDLVVQALIAAELLATKGIEVRVIDCHTLKPS